MLMTKKKANRLIKEAGDNRDIFVSRAYDIGYRDGREYGYSEGHHEGYENGVTETEEHCCRIESYKRIDVCISEDKAREVIDKMNNENKRYRYL